MNRYSTLIIGFFLFIFLLISSVRVLGQTPSVEYITGDNCFEYHENFFVDIKPVYDDEKKLLKVILDPTDSRILFDANTSVLSVPLGNELLSEQNQTTINSSTKHEFTWILQNNPTSGIIVIDSFLTVKVVNLPIHKNYEALYHLNISYDFSSQIALTPSIFDLFNWDLTNQIVGQLSLIFLISTSIMGMKGSSDLIKVLLRYFDKKIKNYQINNVHCEFGELTMFFAFLHAIMSVLSPFWMHILRLWIFPTRLLPDSIIRVLVLQDILFGLELGRISLIFLLLSVFAGIYYSKLVKRVTRRYALLTQQITYFTIILLIIHTFTVGRLNREIFVLRLFDICILFLPLLLKLFFSIKDSKVFDS